MDMGLKHFVLPLLVYFGQAVSGETWSNPINIASNPSWGPAVAANDRGEAVVVCKLLDSSGIVGIARSLDDWLNPVQISNTDNSDADPITAIDADGYCYALWKNIDPVSGLERLKSARLPTPDFLSWIVDKDFPSIPATAIDQYQIAHDKYSYATAAWSVQRDREFYIEAAQFDRVTHAWKAISPISLGAKCKGFDLKLDSQGTTWLIWVNYSTPYDVVYVSSLLPGDTRWAPPQILSRSKEILEPQIAIDPKDNILVFWQQNEMKFVNQFYKKPAYTDAWIKTVFPALKNTSWPYSQVTFDQKGNALFLWDQSTYVINSASLSAHGEKWNKAGAALKECAFTWDSAVDTKGNRLLAYSGDTGYFKAITLPAGQSTWSSPSNVAPQTYVNAGIDLVALYGDKALVIYCDDGAIKAVEGTSLFPQTFSSPIERP